MTFHKWWFLRSILKYGSPFISTFERSGIKKHGSRQPDHPSLFIIGPPRSGSTIFYQLITSLLDVSYIDNLTNLARYNPYFGMKLSQKLFLGQTHKSYTSSYGQTSSDGLHAPAEALFFYKWFPKDQHFTLPSDLSRKQIDEFRATIHAIINFHNKPLIIKNLSFSLRLQALLEYLPDARYIVVKRDPLYTAQSILLGMRKNHQPENKVWGILPKEYKKLEGLEPHEMVVRQVNQIERQIYSDLKNIPDEKILYIEYETLGSSLDSILEDVINLCQPGVIEKTGVPLPDIRIQNRMNLPEYEIELLKGHIASLDWELHNM